MGLLLSRSAPHPHGCYLSIPQQLHPPLSDWRSRLTCPLWSLDIVPVLWTGLWVGKPSAPQSAFASDVEDVGYLMWCGGVSNQAAYSKRYTGCARLCVRARVSREGPATHARGSLWPLLTLLFITLVCTGRSQDPRRLHFILFHDISHSVYSVYSFKKGDFSYVFVMHFTSNWTIQSHCVNSVRMIEQATLNNFTSWSREPPWT